VEDHSTHGGSPRGYGPDGHAAPGGAAVAADGLRLVPSETRFDPGTPTEWTFRVVDEDGEAVTDFEAAHGRPSHLVVVRRDLTRFQHRHPELDGDGTWRVEEFALPDPGVYRAFVDIVVDGTPTTLGFDLFAAGPADVARDPTPRGRRRLATTRSNCSPTRLRPGSALRCRSNCGATATRSENSASTSARSDTSWRSVRATWRTSTSTRRRVRSTADASSSPRGFPPGTVPAVPPGEARGSPHDGAVRRPRRPVTPAPLLPVLQGTPPEAM